MQGANKVENRRHPTLGQIETALAQGVALKEWWVQIEKESGSIDRFDLIPESPGFCPTWGFFGEAPVLGETVAVMGVVQEFFFDRVRAAEGGGPAAQWMLEQVREFALRYYLRVSSWNPAQDYPELGHLAAPRYLQELSWCPPADVGLEGISHRQLYYRRLPDGQMSAFPVSHRTAIVDLRTVGSEYAWIVIQGDLFSFGLAVGAAGSDLPQIEVPLNQHPLTVVSSDLICNQLDPEPGVLGTFGPGFAFLKAPGRSVVAYGPDKVQPGLMLTYFKVHDSGEVRAFVLTIFARPTKILNLSLDPIDWSLEAADLTTLGLSAPLTEPLRKAMHALPLPRLTLDPIWGTMSLVNQLSGGRAARELCISKEHIEKEMLILHALAMQSATLGSRANWDQVPDWLQPSKIPDWAKRGEIPGAADR